MPISPSKVIKLVLVGVFYFREMECMQMDENGELLKMRNELYALEEQLKAVQRERDIANLTSQYEKAGYGDLAKETAIAHVDRDIETLFRNQQKILDQANSRAVDSAEIREKKANETDPFEDFIKGFTKF